MRRFWVAGVVGLGLSLCFVALLVVGTYSAAAGLVGGGGGAVALAKGAVPAKYQRLVQQWGNLCPAINPALLAAQLYQESGWDPDVVSPAKAQGIAPDQAKAQIDGYEKQYEQAVATAKQKAEAAAAKKGAEDQKKAAAESAEWQKGSKDGSKA